MAAARASWNVEKIKHTQPQLNTKVGKTGAKITLIKALKDREPRNYMLFPPEVKESEGGGGGGFCVCRCKRV